MNKNITFVTCIYDNLYQTEFGGRPHPTRKYFFGIESALKMNSPYVIFTWPDQVDRVKNYFKDFLGEEKFNELIRVLEYDLHQTEIREMIKLEKQKNTNVPGDRSHDVQIGKFYMLRKAIELNLFDSDAFFWIDAGLSSSALFPNKYLDQNSGERKYSYCSLFTPKISEKLIENSSDKILLLKLNAIGHWFDQNHLPNNNGYFYIIGGLFGGQKNQVFEFCQKCVDSFKDHLLNKSTFYMEEQILTIVYSFNKPDFNVIEFDVWYHENSGEWVQDKIVGKKNFYKIFEEFNL